MGPLDYSGAFAPIDPQHAMMQGMQVGSAIGEMQDKRALQQAALEKAQKDAIARQQMQDELSDLSENPTTGGIAKFAIKYPGMSEGMKRSYEMLDPMEKQSQLNKFTQIYSAYDSGNPAVALDLMKKDAEALRNSGNKHAAGAADAMISIFEKNPQAAKLYAGKMLSAVAGPDKFAKTFGELGDAERAAAEGQADLAIKKADAVKKGAEATVAAGTIPALIQKPIEDNLSAAAKRRIDDLNVQISQANSETDRGRLVLERDKFIAEQGKKTQESGAGAQDALDSANALVEQIRGVKTHPGLSKGTGTGGGIMAFFNSSDANDFRKSVEGLKAPVFLNELGKLKAAGITLGAVTEAEGKKLEQRIANLDTDQSTPAFKNQVGVLLRDTEKFIEKIKASGKLPTTGGAFVMNHPKLGRITESDINNMLTKNPGSTRDQVMEFLRTAPTGGASGDY